MNFLNEKNVQFQEVLLPSLWNVDNTMKKMLNVNYII